MQFKQLDVAYKDVGSRAMQEHIAERKRSCRLSVELYKYSEKIKNYGYRDQVTRVALSVLSL